MSLKITDPDRYSSIQPVCTDLKAVTADEAPVGTEFQSRIADACIWNRKLREAYIRCSSKYLVIPRDLVIFQGDGRKFLGHCKHHFWSRISSQ